MAIIRQTIVHEGPGGLFESAAIWDDATSDQRPGVLLFPNFLGIKDADFARAEQVAALGYVVFVADVYGQGNRASWADADPGRFMMTLQNDRALLRDRVMAALSELQKVPAVDAARCAAIGYCFGGKCVLDLARTGGAIVAGISFHGVYDRPDFDNATPIKTKLLICHGWDDPLCPPDATIALAKELTEGGADWQLHAYGHTGHAFTDADVNKPEMGLFFQPDAERRSWQAMRNFFAETLA